MTGAQAHQRFGSSFDTLELFLSEVIVPAPKYDAEVHSTDEGVRQALEWSHLYQTWSQGGVFKTHFEHQLPRAVAGSWLHQTQTRSRGRLSLVGRF